VFGADKAIYQQSALCSSVFLAPVNLGSDEANDEYRHIVKRPMDLTTLLSTLKDRSFYRTVQAWAHDVELIFENAIFFNGATSYLAGIARYFRAKSDRHVPQIRLRSESRLPPSSKQNTPPFWIYWPVQRLGPN
jgi:hypothetical protein